MKILAWTTDQGCRIRQHPRVEIDFFLNGTAWMRKSRKGALYRRSTAWYCRSRLFPFDSKRCQTSLGFHSNVNKDDRTKVAAPTVGNKNYAPVIAGESTPNFSDLLMPNEGQRLNSIYFHSTPTHHAFISISFGPASLNFRIARCRFIPSAFLLVSAHFASPLPVFPTLLRPL